MHRLPAPARFAVLPTILALVAGCCTAALDAPVQRVHAADAVIGKLWQWEETVTPAERVQVIAPQRYTLLLMADGHAAVRFDCNRGGGSYQLAAGRLSFGPMISTLMACPPDSQGSRYASDLGQVAGFFVEGDWLFLEMPADGGTMRFRAAR